MKIYDMIPKPDLFKAKHILCIQPHPDDNEIGAGGTLALLAQAQVKLSYLTISPGRGGSNTLSSNELVKLRQNELVKAGQVLGVGYFEQLNLDETHYPDELTLTSSIVDVIRRLKPDGVISVDPTLLYEAHPTHRKTGTAVLEACMFASMRHFPKTDGINEFEPHQVEWVAFYGSAHPNLTIDIQTTFNLKCEAIAQHASQFKGASYDQLIQYLQHRAFEEGKKIASPCAESFKVLPMILTHMMVESETY